jgi:transglutaminase-like putative cysteine protease
LFGLDLPTGAEIDAIAVEPIYTPNPIKDKYLQLKGDTTEVYINNNDDFAYHYNVLDGIIISSDNAFIVADKIRNYLQYNFARITDPSQYNPAPEGYDHVEWFCEQEIGYWSDFASAFCAFARAFGIASRFVDGFNSFTIQEFYDTVDSKNTVAIKYKNLYNWAEVYIPTSISGDGQWVQMDVYYENYGANPPSLENYILTLNSDFIAGYRGNVANLTATLTLDGAPVDGATISFYDLNSYQYLGQANTNLYGDALLSINIDNTQVVGPHYILAQFNPSVNATTNYTVYGDIQVNLQNINPQEVNISLDTRTNIQGYVIDPINNQRVSGTTIEIVLLQKGTNNRIGTPPFDITFTTADSNGDFNMDINVDPSVPVGQYDLRVDTNGSWYFTDYAVGFVNDSSNRMDFNVTKEPVKEVWFYINDIPSNISYSPVVNRSSTLILKAIVVNETNYPLANQDVFFYDYTRDFYLGLNTTNDNGITTLHYSLDNSITAGPNLLYAKFGIEENYSYFILNEEPIINILSGPIPREINRTGAGASNTIFNVEGEILDNTNSNPIKYSELHLKLLKGGTDYSTYLMPSSAIWTDSNGYFNFNFEVVSDTPTGNYTLRLDFNGTINYDWHPVYPTSFNLSYINTSSTFANELKVTTPATLLFNFWINDTTSDDYNQPVIVQGGGVNLSVYLEWGSVPIGDGEWIDFYDITQDIAIHSVQTINGFAQVLYSTNSSTVAGPHLIYAKWGSNYNYSYFIYDTLLSINLESGPIPSVINRSGSFGTSFNLYGFINDSLNGYNIKYCQIEIYLYDGPTDVSHYLSLDAGYLQLDETGEFNITYSVSDSTPAKNYTLQIEFNGIFKYSLPFNQFNEHDFYLFSFNNFTDIVSLTNKLQVLDPENITILFFIDGTPTLSNYNNTNPPERYNWGNKINFTVFITQSGTPVDSGVVTFTDVYINEIIASYPFQTGDGGYFSFENDTSSWHAGLHQIRVQWSIYDTFNTTYIIINETIIISRYPNKNSIQRNFDGFTISGTVLNGTTPLRGLRIKILLFDGSTDVSGYLNLATPQIITIDNDGIYQFIVNSISLNCPQGQYFIRIDFNGSISEAGIFLTDYMVNTSSLPLPINITAGTSISGYYYTEYFNDRWYQTDNLYVIGNLTWDNSSFIVGMEINVTIRDSIGNIITSELGITDAWGGFNVTFSVGDWPDDVEIWASFDPEDPDNFGSVDGAYINPSDQELYRNPNP